MQRYPLLLLVAGIVALTTVQASPIARRRYYVHGNSLRVSKPGSFESVKYYGPWAEVIGKPHTTASVVFDIQTLTFDSRMGATQVDVNKPLIQYRVNGLDTHLDEVRLYAGERLLYVWDKLPAKGTTDDYSIFNTNGFVSMFLFMKPPTRDVRVQPISLEVKVKFGGGGTADRTMKFVAVSAGEFHNRITRG